MRVWDEKVAIRGSYSWAGARHSAPPGTVSSPLCPALRSKLQTSFINCIQGFPCLLPSTELTSRGSRRRWESGRTGGLPPCQATSCHFMYSPTKAVVGVWAPGTPSFLTSSGSELGLVSLILSPGYAHLPLSVFCNPALTFVNSLLLSSPR